MKLVGNRVCAIALFVCCFGILGVDGRATEIPEIKHKQSEPDSSTVESLLAAAAKDFALPGSPHPVGIRQARVGRMPDGSGNYNYLLCGKFLPVDKQGTKEWVPFATIMTGDYEQWLGGHASSYCLQRQIKWYKADQSSALLKRILEQTDSRKPAL
jgi:hypothetical protein